VVYNVCVCVCVYVYVCVIFPEIRTDTMHACRRRQTSHHSDERQQNDDVCGQVSHDVAFRNDTNMQSVCSFTPFSAIEGANDVNRGYPGTGAEKRLATIGPTFKVCDDLSNISRRERTKFMHTNMKMYVLA